MIGQGHMFSPMYPRFAAMGCKGGDSSCRKKHNHDEMGCGGGTPYDDEELGCGDLHISEDERLGCDKCEQKRRRKKKYEEEVAVFGWAGTTLRGGAYPVMNRALMGWNPAPAHNHNPYLGQLTCPASPPALDPTLNCQRDARGNAVCSDGKHYPPGCPHTPPEEYFSPGIAPDETHGGIIEAKIPAPRAAGTAGAAGVPSAPGAAPAGGGASPLIPIAAIGGVGLLAAVFLLR